MRRTSSFVAAWLLLLAVPGLLVAQPPDGFARSQAVDVSEALLASDGADTGWVAVRIDASAAPHLGVDLTVLSPGGESLPWVSLRQAEGRRSLDIVSVRPARESGRPGFWIRLDLGAEPPRHTRLHFGVGERTLVSGVVLESSTDARSWSPLVRGDLFRLGTDASFQSLALDYPASDARHLRLFWPGDAAPLLDNAWVLAEGEGVSSREVPLQSLTAELGSDTGGAWGLTLDVPRQSRRLDLELAAEGAFGLRLFVAEDGTWRLLAEESRRRVATADRTLRLPLDLDRREPARLRVVVRGAELESARAWIADPVVAFRPRGAGRHEVAWGAAGKPRRSEETGHGDGSRWPRLEAGPVEEAPLARGVAASRRPGGAAPGAELRRRLERRHGRRRTGGPGLPAAGGTGLSGGGKGRRIAAPGRRRTPPAPSRGADGRARGPPFAPRRPRAERRERHQPGGDSGDGAAVGRSAVLGAPAARTGTVLALFPPFLGDSRRAGGGAAL